MWSGTGYFYDVIYLNNYFFYNLFLMTKMKMDAEVEQLGFYEIEKVRLYI